MEILHEVKKKANFWKIATVIVLAVAIMELLVIIL